ncbi:unnamed protein product, partial [Discosporangium mesarthrocarpum]
MGVEAMNIDVGDVETAPKSAEPKTDQAYCLKLCDALCIDEDAVRSRAMSYLAVNNEIQPRAEGGELGGRLWGASAVFLALYQRMDHTVLSAG